MAKTNRRKRHRILALIAAGAMALVVVLIVANVIVVLLRPVVRHTALPTTVVPTPAVKAMTDMNNRCPLTSYVLAGFSQGAVIAGDMASDIGNGRGPVDEDLVLGVALIADGRRQDNVGQDIGPNPDGQGAEITLQEVPTLSALGLTMSGPRPGGFGKLNDRTNEICAPGDLICAAPESAFNITQLPRTLEVLSGGAG